MNAVALMNDSSKGLFLIFLAILCNYLAGLMNCSIQRSFKTYPKLQWFCVFILIFFTINFTSDPKTSPMIVGFNAFLIFLCFILFMKQTLLTFLINLILLVMIFSLNQWITYYKNKETPEEQKIKSIENMCMVLQIMLAICLIGGTGMYYSIQKSDRGDNFNHTEFFFGVNQCQSLTKPISLTKGRQEKPLLPK